MTERNEFLLYKMLKATIMTMGKVPGDHQKTFSEAESEFLRSMEAFDSKQGAVSSNASSGSPKELAGGGM